MQKMIIIHGNASIGTNAGPYQLHSCRVLHDHVREGGDLLISEDSLTVHSSLVG